MKRHRNIKIHRHEIANGQKDHLLMGQKRLLVLVIMTLTLFSFHPAASAQDDEYTRPTLRGLEGVHVFVEAINPEVERDGLARDQLQAEIEQQLRNAGIKLLSKEEQILSKGRPYLYVYLHIIKFGTRITRYLFYIQVEFNQDVYLMRNPTIWAPAITWSTGGTGIDFSLDNVRSVVKKKVEDFIKAFLEVNRRQEGNKKG